MSVMADQIRYRINYEKAIEAIVWLTTQQPGIDIYHIVFSPYLPP